MKNRTCRACKYCGAHLDPEERRGYKEHIIIKNQRRIRNMTVTATFESIEEIKAFAGLFSGQAGTGTENEAPVPAATPASSSPAPIASVPTAPASAYMAAPTTATPASTPSVVPTSMTSYTLEDLVRAVTALMDAGKQMDLQGLLARFGVNVLTALPPAQYGAFATALREMGAQI